MFQTFENTGGPEHVAERVKALRASLSKAGVDAVLVPRSDEYQGEYVPACAERLNWLTGFSGSAGLAVVTRKAAALFIDGRYTVQARSETDTAVFDLSHVNRGRIHEWLSERLSKGQRLGFDPWLHTVSEIARLKAALEPKGIALKPLARNPIDALWGDERPKPPAGEIRPQPIEFSGRSSADKIADLQKTLKDSGQQAAVLTLSDTICWLFNIRGSDVAHNPIVRAYAIVPASGKAELFIDPDRAGKDVRAEFVSLVRLRPAKEFLAQLRALKSAGKKVRLDPNSAAFALEQTLGPKSAVRGEDPCIAAKATKNAVEIAGARAAHLRDGAAMVHFLAWLDEATADGSLDEITVVKKLEEFRRHTNALREISFPTIAGSGPNGAIVHYRVTKKTNRKLRPGELFLIDSGAQYQDGTTDVTRTVAVGEPTAEMRTRFTAVLKGHIQVATARFPKGTRGIDLDPFARRPLWEMGADYDHGTGHGIGSYLSVHEGPQSISRAGMALLQPGMLLSNEPGFYKEGEYGIRIENVVLVTEPKLVEGGAERETMGFETLTLVPIDRRLIVSEMLTPVERDWINDYHKRVYWTLTRNVDSRSSVWLEAATAPI